MADSLSLVQTAPHEGPMYLAIRSVLEKRIANGEYAVGVALPSENQLAEEFDTTRITMRNAMESLVVDGVLRRVKGKGTFVVGKLSSPIDQVLGFRETARLHHLEPSVRTLSRGRRQAGPLYARLFEIEPTDELFSLRRLNSIDGMPVAIESALIPLERIPGVEERDPQVFSLYETYAMDGHEVVGAQELLGITKLSARDAGLLKTSPGSAALTIEIVSFDGDGHAVEHVDAVMAGDHALYTYRY